MPLTTMTLSCKSLQMSSSYFMMFCKDVSRVPCSGNVRADSDAVSADDLVCVLLVCAFRSRLGQCVAIREQFPDARCCCCASCDCCWSLLADVLTWSPAACHCELPAEPKSQNIAIRCKHFLIHVHVSQCETVLRNHRFAGRLRSKSATFSSLLALCTRSL